jgi:hypothetical protein
MLLNGSIRSPFFWLRSHEMRDTHDLLDRQDERNATPGVVQSRRPSVELLRTMAQRGTARGRWEVAKVWNTIFPLVEPAQGDDGYGVVQLNSNAPSHLLLTNAIGVVNPSQLSALKSILRNSPRRLDDPL